MRDGRSVDTTMGFSPLEGVPMATRSGSVDPGALLYLLRERGLAADELDHALNFDSGLRALSGHEGGMRELEQAVAAGDEAAKVALDVFLHRLAGAVAAMAAAAGGLDAIVFTAGIGENSVTDPRRSCAGDSRSSGSSAGCRPQRQRRARLRHRIAGARRCVCWSSEPGGADRRPSCSRPPLMADAA